MTISRPDSLQDGARRALLKTGAFAAASMVVPVPGGAASAALATGVDAEALDLWSRWLDALVPGAAAAGAARYLASQLSLPREASVLFLRYMDWPGSYAAFYQDGLSAVDTLAQKHFGGRFGALDAEARTRLIDEVGGGKPRDWRGPPAGLFYFVSKADGADLVFGSTAGIEALGLSYRAHIEPPSVWPGKSEALA